MDAVAGGRARADDGLRPGAWRVRMTVFVLVHGAWGGARLLQGTRTAARGRPRGLHAGPDRHRRARPPDQPAGVPHHALSTVDSLAGEGVTGVRNRGPCGVVGVV